MVRKVKQGNHVILAGMAGRMRLILLAMMVAVGY